MREFPQRLFGAMFLDAATYERIEADPTAIRQAILVVVAFAIAAGVGLTWPAPAPRALIVGIAASLAGWLSWAALVYYLGVHVFPAPETRGDIGQLARTIGFSAAPGVFAVLLAVPVIRPAVVAVISLWMLAAMVVAVRHALDYSGAGRAVAVCTIGFFVQSFFFAGLFLLLGSPDMM
jgi:hypothetical protein